MPLDVLRRAGRAGGGRFGERSRSTRSCEAVDLLQTVGQPELVGQFPRESAAAGEALDQGRAARQRPRTPRDSRARASRTLPSSSACSASRNRGARKAAQTSGRDDRGRGTRRRAGSSPGTARTAGGGTTSAIARTGSGSRRRGAAGPPCGAAGRRRGRPRRDSGRPGRSPGTSGSGPPSPVDTPGENRPRPWRAASAREGTVPPEHLGEHAAQRVQVGSRVDPRGDRPPRSLSPRPRPACSGDM